MTEFVIAAPFFIAALGGLIYIRDAHRTRLGALRAAREAGWASASAGTCQPTVETSDLLPNQNPSVRVRLEDAENRVGGVFQGALNAPSFASETQQTDIERVMPGSGNPFVGQHFTHCNDFDRTLDRGYRDGMQDYWNGRWE